MYRNPPVRRVCRDCLQSLERLPDDAGRLPTLCPSCGGTIDSRLSELETPTMSFPMPPRHDAAAGEHPWGDAWSRGTLGTIGRFQLRELIGDGGFGIVYQAYDPRLDRDVALKVLKQSDPGERVMQRFFREARAAARLSHTNIVSVFDAGCDAGRCWIAYQFVDGRTLASYRDHQKIDIPTAVRITRDLADALDHAHREGVFHRDLKPANVILDAAGRPHLIDFGLARRADVDSDLTREGAILGTPDYMSPEQADGHSNQADERSDVFSLGVILFELLCGRRPVDPSSEPPPGLAKPPAAPPPPRAINKDIPAALERMVLKSLATDPAERYPDARAFARDLDRWLKAREGVAGLSLPLTSVLLVIAAALILAVGLIAVLSPITRSGSATAPEANEAIAKAVRVKNPSWPTAPAVDAGGKLTFVGNTVTKKYHITTCEHIQNSSNLVPLRDEEDAKSRGWTLCQFCDRKLRHASAARGEAAGKAARGGP